MLDARAEGILRAEDLGFDERFAMADFYVDRHLREGRGEATALVCGAEELTYAELADDVRQTALTLRVHHGVGAENRVVIMLPDSPAFVRCFFGAMRLGAVPVPVSTATTARDLAFVLEDSRAAAIVGGDVMRRVVEQLRAEGVELAAAVVTVGDDGRLEASPEGDDTMPRLHRDDVAFWLYTSGTTGKPKACVHLQHDVPLMTILYADRFLGLGAEDRTFSISKLFFAYGLSTGLLHPLGVGATAILWPGQPTAAAVLDVVERHRPTVVFGVPRHFAALAAWPGTETPELAGLRFAVSSGEALPPTVYHAFRTRFGVELLDSMGATEMMAQVISNVPGEVRPGSSGKVIPGFAAALLDEDGAPVPPGEVGNLFVASDTTCREYWNRHELSKRAFLGDWYRTGDKYVQDGDGYLWYVGRSDDMFKVSGMWVSPIEVENAIMRHEAVEDAAVVARSGQDGLAEAVAFVVLREGHADDDRTRASIAELVELELPISKRPSAIELVDRLPRTETGKKQRVHLRSMLSQR